MNGVREQRHAARDKDHSQLEHGGGGETDERPLDRPQSAFACRDRGINDAMGMAVSLSMVIVIIVLMVPGMVVCMIAQVQSSCSGVESRPRTSMVWRAISGPICPMLTSFFLASA